MHQTIVQVKKAFGYINITSPWNENEIMNKTFVWQQHLTTRLSHCVYLTFISARNIRLEYLDVHNCGCDESIVKLEQESTERKVLLRGQGEKNEVVTRWLRKHFKFAEFKHVAMKKTYAVKITTNVVHDVLLALVYIAAQAWLPEVQCGPEGSFFARGGTHRL